MALFPALHYGRVCANLPIPVSDGVEQERAALASRPRGVLGEKLERVVLVERLYALLVVVSLGQQRHEVDALLAHKLLHPGLFLARHDGREGRANQLGVAQVLRHGHQLRQREAAGHNAHLMRFT